MKKVAFAIVMFFAIIAVSDTILAETDTEYEKALRYYNLGKYEEAIRLFKHYIEKEPNPSAYYYTGYALYKIGKYSEANKYFKMTYVIDPMFSPITHSKSENRESNKPTRKNLLSKITSGAESKDKQTGVEKGNRLNRQQRVKQLWSLTLLYIIASIASQKG